MKCLPLIYIFLSIILFILFSDNVFDRSLAFASPSLNIDPLLSIIPSQNLPLQLQQQQNQTSQPLSQQQQQQPPSYDLLVRDFAVIMIVATVMLLITYKLKQSMVIGYLLAGIVIGPYTPPFSYIHNIDTLNAFAELGIIMLLFVIGTDFPIKRLKEVGRISTLVALAESMGTLLITFFVSQMLGFSYYDSLFIALALSVTSTVVTIKILEELGMIRDKSTTLLLGISIVEDIIAITALGVLQSIASETGNITILDILISIGTVGAFIGGTLYIGSKFVPKLIDRISKINDYALILISVLGLAFFLSFLAQNLGLSVATGAFLAGVLTAEAKSASVARVLTTPLRDMFAALFFISVGALMNVSLIPAFILPSLILIAISFSSKFLIVTAILKKANYNNSTAIRTGLGMSAARGELSLVIAKVGQDIGVISSIVFPILGVITIITTFLTPYVLKLGTRLGLNTPPPPPHQTHTKDESNGFESETEKDSENSRS